MTIPLPKRTANYLSNGAPEGRRNEELFYAAQQFHDAGCPQIEAENELLNRAITDGLSEHEARLCIHSAYSYPQREPISGSPNPVTGGIRKLTKAEKERIVKCRREAGVAKIANTSKAAMFRDYACSVEWFFEHSPRCLTESDPKDEWKLLLFLFPPTDVIWIGRTIHDSANIGHQKDWIETCKRRFRTANDWMMESVCPGLFTCPSAFIPGVHSRTNENVLHRRYLVVESDTLSKDDICAVFNWTRQFCRLRAIVDTAGKSLHGWFDLPTQKIFDDLKIILPIFGCDRALFKPSQPCRIPGGLRDGKFQTLLYLDSQP